MSRHLRVVGPTDQPASPERDHDRVLELTTAAEDIGTAIGYLTEARALVAEHSDQLEEVVGHAYDAAHNAREAVEHAHRGET